MQNLEESVPEEIEREVAANEEQESDLGRAIEDARNRNWGFGRVESEERKEE